MWTLFLDHSGCAKTSFKSRNGKEPAVKSSKWLVLLVWAWSHFWWQRTNRCWWAAAKSSWRCWSSLATQTLSLRRVCAVLGWGVRMVTIEDEVLHLASLSRNSSALANLISKEDETGLWSNSPFKSLSIDGSIWERDHENADTKERHMYQDEAGRSMSETV